MHASCRTRELTMDTEGGRMTPSPETLKLTEPSEFFVMPLMDNGQAAPLQKVHAGVVAEVKAVPPPSGQKTLDT